jgi:uncharacterized membrane protein YccC
MPKRGKKKPRKIKFFKKNLKIPESQNKLLRQFCKAHHTTENKVFRKAMREYLQRNIHISEHQTHDINANQLTLFDLFGDENNNTGT